MAIDAHANFATSLVATAPSPATSGTSLVVTTGDGAKFPAVPFNATICPASTAPTTANAEIVRVTARSTDTLTITRAQESTTARTVVVGDQIFAGITAKTLTDVEGGVLLTCIQYAPSTVTAYSSTSTTPVAVDSTNLTVSFTAPSSGKVLVRLGGVYRWTAGSGAYWGLVDHGTTTLRGSLTQPGWNVPNVLLNYSVPFLITGLTAGTAYQFDWAWCVTSAASSQMWVQGSITTTSGGANPQGPAVMEVWSA